MLVDILEKMQSILSQANISLEKIDFDLLTDSEAVTATTPTVNLGINNGTPVRITHGGLNSKVSYTDEPIISLVILVNDLSGEENRRHISLGLLEEIRKVFTQNYLGLKLTSPLEPKPYRNITTKPLNDAGYCLYEMLFSCKYTFTKDNEEQGASDLLTFVNEYYLHNPNDDGNVDLESTVNVKDVDGGNYQNKPDPIQDIDGGGANVENIIEDIDGGGASE